MNLTREQIDNLYQVAIEEVQKVRFDNDFMNILSSLWGVYEKPSTGEDSRYAVLGDEIVKHYVMNDDWPDDKLFISILKIKEDESLLLRFIQELIHFQDDNINDVTLQKIKVNLPNDIEFNKGDDGAYSFFDKGGIMQQTTNQKVRFYKCLGRYAFKKLSIIQESIPQNIGNNVFLIAFNSWDDYGNKTSCVLYYKDLEGNTIEIGGLKLMKRGEKNTYDVIDESFYSLSNDYCSLGQDVSYYEKMYELFKNDAYIYLRALCDAAVFSKIHECFEKDTIFEVSLYRDNIAEKALREGRFIINGREMKNAYAFSYLYKPNYYSEVNSASIPVSFDFKYQCMPYERVYGLIGENGVGKTTLLEKIIESLTDETKKDGFDGLRPIFSKVMVISYSPFDSFPTKKKDSIIDYLYCGLLDSEKAILSKENQNNRLKENIEKINERSSIIDPISEIWVDIMKEVFPDSVIKSFYNDAPFTYELYADTICKKCGEMSSGETIFIFAISDIIANIRQDTLLLFDEPEQHLHPHGIMQLIRAIYTILEKFESYAIIATHSPLVIREMLSKNVYVFNREEDYLHIAKIGIECFGEDIAILNDIVFKNRSENKQYEKYIDELVEKSNNYCEVVSILQNEHNELGLNTRLLIQSAFEKKKGGQR